MSTGLIQPHERPRDPIEEWHVTLGVLTAGRISQADAEMKLRAYIPLLRDRYPPAAFCQASLEHVAARCRFFPAYGEIVEHLGEWWRENRPRPPALPPAEATTQAPREPPTDEERAAVREMVRQVTASLAGAPEGLTQAVTPRCLPPELLDEINPLPNGRKRVQSP